MISKFARRKKSILKEYAGIRGKQTTWWRELPRLVTPDDLEVGDVVFCGKDYTDKPASLIQNLTDGPYVHCGIYIGSAQVIHVGRKGTECTGLDEFQMRYSYLAFARFPGMTLYTKRAVVRYAKLCFRMDVRYNWIGALLLPITEYFYMKFRFAIPAGLFIPLPIKKPFITRGRLFCSEFLVQCYKACGCISKQDPFSISHYFSPTLLAEEHSFELVGYMALRGLSAVEKDDPFLEGCSYALEKAIERQGIYLGNL